MSISFIKINKYFIKGVWFQLRLYSDKWKESSQSIHNTWDIIKLLLTVLIIIDFKAKFTLCLKWMSPPPPNRRRQLLNWICQFTPLRILSIARHSQCFSCKKIKVFIVLRLLVCRPFLTKCNCNIICVFSSTWSVLSKCLLIRNIRCGWGRETLWTCFYLTFRTS